jgi:trimethylamine-N-oxide reductase (cytochrome c)
MREIPTCKVRGPDGYMYEPIWIHPTDAAAKGIVSGDIVKIYNERGIVLGGAYVTQRIMPGAVWQDHGSVIDEIERGQIDRGGSNNMICPLWGISQYCLGGEATSGFLVQIEKLSLDEMEQWKKDYPDAFARKYDYASGCTFEAWIANEGGTD